MAESGDKIEWFIHDGEREIGPLREVELRKRLKRARRGKLRVRQNDGPWHPAQTVVKKFRELAENGIYIKLGTVAGPYTAERAFAILRKLSLDGVQAKIGLHGSWVSADRLLEKLQHAIDKANAGQNQPANNGDDPSSGSPQSEFGGDTDDSIELFPLNVTPAADSDDTSESIPTIEPISESGAKEDSLPVAEPIAAKPDDAIVTVQPVRQQQIPTVEPVRVEPTTVQPITVQPITVQPVTVPPIPAKPISVQPITVQPITVQPITVQPIVNNPPATRPALPSVQPIPNKTAATGTAPIPVVQPIQSATTKTVDGYLMHQCVCGRQVRVLPQFAGVTMQCPACKRTFVV